MTYPAFGKIRLPKTEQAKPYTLKLSGTHVNFTAPPFSAKWGEQEDLPLVLDIFEQNNYLPNPSAAYPFIRCFDTSWSIRGMPLIQNELGWIGFSIAVIRAKSDQNLFNHSIFQNILENHLESMYGENGVTNRYTTETLLNSSIEKINDITWLSFFQRREKAGEPSFSLFWKTPISEQHILSFCFNYITYEDTNKIHESLNYYAKELMNSVAITPSTALKEQKAAAEKQWPNQKYPEHMEPLRWIRPKKDFISVEEYFADDE